MKIIESSLLTEQFRFPRTKKRRIRNKWFKRAENHRPVMNRGFMMGDSFVCHPKMAQLLRDQCAPPPDIQDAISKGLFDLL